ncbi:MAG: tRNA (adenosine(37)-N6)-threonylcarbamoyltransferase complex dimerization subunit type 1 TsaB [Elusimicrobiota bacterium]|jgi:tRNA threonylcarbamoyl adenosine modification protein YeaZ|nr:tRNA (adenosine(37)-N6)-threonylcarbamoyltransferase complex dimerization subunit type 1 TsaB [Elusimicrobiota bacterium]
MAKNKVILALDSSASPLLCALEARGKVYAAKKSGLKQEELIFPLLKKLFAGAGCALADVDKVFFIKGPGRFTGIRIGITLASMLNVLAGSETASATVFDALKYQAAGAAKGRVIVAVAHASRDEYFAQICDGKQQPLWLGLDDLKALLKKQKRPLFICGRGKDGAPLKTILGGPYSYAPAALNKIRGATLIALAKITKTPKAQVLEPLYLKPARFETGK